MAKNRSAGDSASAKEIFIEARDMAVNLQKWFEEYYIPLEVEIGSEVGEFLCKMAQRHLDTRFIGIDIIRSYCLRAARLAERLGLSNIKFVNVDAGEFITKYIPSNSVRIFHIYFPSPAPWHRRFINQDFVNHLYRALRLDGSIRIVTDRKDYYDEIYNCFVGAQWWHMNWAELTVDQSDGLLIGTRAEIRYGSKYILQVMK